MDNNRENDFGASEIKNIFSKMSTFNPKAKIVLNIAIIGLVVLFFSLKLFFVYVEPNKFGIKIIRIGTNRGVQKKIYGPGLHFVLPFGFQEMHKLPRDIQVLELTSNPKAASRYARVERAAHIQTSDGFFVEVDVSILYKIIDPYLVFTKIGPNKLFQDNGIVPRTEPILKISLGELTTEEFYNDPQLFDKLILPIF